MPVITLFIFWSLSVDVVGAEQSSPPPSAIRYRATLTKIAQREFGLSAPVARFGAQVDAESGWIINARSPVGASGLGQIMPATAQWIADQDPSFFPIDLHSPSWSLQALVRYMRLMLADVYGPDDCSLWWAALRAYNGGIGHWKREAALSDGDGKEDIDYQCGRSSRGRSHCRENLSYPRRILLKLEPMYINAGWIGSIVCREES